MSEHYHQIIPETICDRVRSCLGRFTLFHVNWDGPLDSPLEPVVDWPEHVSIPVEPEQLDFFS